MIRHINHLHGLIQKLQFRYGDKDEMVQLLQVDLKANEAEKKAKSAWVNSRFEKRLGRNSLTV